MEEVKKDTTLEEMTALYFDKDALIEQPQRIHRLQQSGKRIYYTYDEKDELDFYVSVTTMIKAVTPTNEYLIKWIADMGYEQSKAYAQERADYGTFMHAEIANFLIDRQIDLDTMDERLLQYIEANRLPSTFINYLDELKKDVLAFAQFAHEYKVKPLAIEVVLAHPEGYAGAVDLVCKMTVEKKGYWGETYKSGANKGKPKESKQEVEIVAIVDFKSGRKGFYEDNEIQLECYRRMWNYHYGKTLPVDNIFNWSPKAWTGATPTYNLKNQTGMKSAQKLDFYIQLAQLEFNLDDTQFSVVSGVVSMDDYQVENNLKKIGISEFVKTKKADKNEPKKQK